MSSKPYFRSLLIGLLLWCCVSGAPGGIESVPATADNAATVRTVQRMLRDRDLYSGAIDGVLSERTRQALKSFQQSADLPPSGQIDDPTLVALGILEPESRPLQNTTESALNGAESVGQATLDGVESAGRGTVNGVSTAGATTARGVATAGSATATTAEATKKTVVAGGEAGLKTTREVGEMTTHGARKLGKGTADGVVRTGTKVTDFLGVSHSDDKIRKEVTRRLERDPHLGAYRIHVSVQEGMVTLVVAGDEAGEEDRDRAAAVASRVKGVRDVVIH